MVANPHVNLLVLLARPFVFNKTRQHSSFVGDAGQASLTGLENKGGLLVK